MKRFPELARRGVALALAASMSLSVFMPGALAADLTTAEEHDHDHDHVHLAAENSVDALGNEDLSDETDTALDETADAADHTWGEWQEGTYQEGEDGEILHVEFRICDDCGYLQLDDGTILKPASKEELETVEPDELKRPLPGTESSGIVMYAAAHDGAHAFNTAWNAGGVMCSTMPETTARPVQQRVGDGAAVQNGGK